MRGPPGGLDGDHRAAGALPPKLEVLSCTPGIFYHSKLMIALKLGGHDGKAKRVARELARAVLPRLLVTVASPGDSRTAPGFPGFLSFACGHTGGLAGDGGEPGQLAWGGRVPRGCQGLSGLHAGAQAGWVVTVASVGDSRASLDTGAGVVQLSVDHRVATHKEERRRLDALGVQIAPIDTSGAGRRGWGTFRVYRPSVATLDMQVALVGTLSAKHIWLEETRAVYLSVCTPIIPKQCWNLAAEIHQ